MNSLSKTHFKDDCEPCKKEHKHCPTILKCGPIGGAIIPADSTTPVTVANLPLNTSGLCNPTINLEFASIISTVVTDVGTITLTFQVNKICRNMLQKLPIGSTWTFTRTFDDEIVFTTTDTFTFFVCDCDICSEDCCTYTVDVIVTTLTASDTITITNASLAAIATCGSKELLALSRKKPPL